MEQQWSDLLPDLVIDIEKRLVLSVDKIRFRSVCKSWRSYLPEVKFPNNNKGTPFPCLLHPSTHNKKHSMSIPHFESESKSTSESDSDSESRSESESETLSVSESEGEEAEKLAEAEEKTEAEEETEASHGLFCPVDHRVYHLNLPDAKGVFFKGSSYGWVITIPDTVTGTGPDMYLINPLTNARIQLPQRSKFPDVIGHHPDKIGTDNEYTVEEERSGEIYDISSMFVNLYLLMKVVLSSNPLSQDCVIVAIYGERRRLAYCKCGDTEWKFLFGGDNAFADVIFHKGKLHALNYYGDVFVFENICHNPNVTKFPAAPPPMSPNSGYLVESCAGELIMAGRYHSRNNNFNDYNNTFTVCKLDPTNSTWVLTNNIGDDMLFLGWNSSLAVSSRDFPGLKGNCIYFADDSESLELRINREGVYIGVFYLDDNCSESLPGYSYGPKLVWPPPVWIIPSTF